MLSTAYGKKLTNSSEDKRTGEHKALAMGVFDLM
jgi:hypothetical protein